MSERTTAVVVGASGGLGSALVRALVERGDVEVRAWARRPGPPVAGVALEPADVEEEASLARAAEALEGGPPLARVFVATGLLHAPGLAPERAASELDPAHLLRLYAVNAVGPALVAKHLLPRFPRRGRAVFAALSARVGSLGDNRTGGWHGYRASKAALNMLLRNLALELARTRPDALAVGLHPGTVDTALSTPFQARLPAGRLRTADAAAARLLRVVDALTPADSGAVFDGDGLRLPD